MPIKNVIFDLGGVLMDLHFERTHAAFTALGADRFRDQWSLSRQTPLFDDFETGRIAPEVFRDGLRRALELPHAADAALDGAWNAMLGEIPAERLNYVQSLRPRYRTFLLSNTNAIHVEQVFSYVRDRHGHPNLDSFFEHAHYSHTLGHRKPTAESFNKVLRTHGLQAAETLFVDDLDANVQAARGVGLQATQVPAGANLAALLGVQLP